MRGKKKRFSANACYNLAWNWLISIKICWYLREGGVETEAGSEGTCSGSRNEKTTCIWVSQTEPNMTPRRFCAKNNSKFRHLNLTLTLLSHWFSLFSLQTIWWMVWCWWYEEECRQRWCSHTAAGCLGRTPHSKHVQIRRDLGWIYSTKIHTVVKIQYTNSELWH